MFFDSLRLLDPPRDGEEAQSLLIERGDPATIGLDTLHEPGEDSRALDSLAFIGRNHGKGLASCHPARRAA